MPTTRRLAVADKDDTDGVSYSADGFDSLTYADSTGADVSDISSGYKVKAMTVFMGFLFILQILLVMW